jgi:Na+/proline symporter
LSAKLTWLFVFVGLYWAYCLSAGLIGARAARTASDFFIAGRRLSLWIFILAATATSFSGWTFMGHPGLVYRDGFSYAYAAFYTITIPLTGVFFLKRQWMLGKRFGYVTPGEMLADYFRGDAIRFLTVFIALLFSIPYVGIQFGASGYLFEVLTDSLINQNLGMWLLALIMLTYLVTGGLRAVAYVDALQCALMIVGIVITGVIALDAVGGWSGLTAGMSTMATMPGKETTQGLGGGDYPAYFAIPGVIQYTAGLGKEAPVGGLWTGVMILTYMFAMMGIQASPAFSMWAFANNNPRPFAPQQVWVSSFGVGFILLFFTMFQGVGAHLLGADAATTRNPQMLAEILRSPNTEIVPAPVDPAKLLVLYDSGAVALVGPGIGKDMTLADIEAAVQAGAEAAADADAGARVAALIKLGVDSPRAERLAGNVRERDAFLARSADLKTAYGAIYRIERAVTLPAVLADATFVQPPLPARRIAENPDFLVPEYFNLIAEEHAWLIGLLAICAMAAMQSTGAAYISAAAGMLTRDFHKRYLRPASSHGTQMLFGRVVMILIVVSALLVSTYSRDALVLLGGLAVAFGLQMAPSLTAVTWCPWITRQGATYGLVAGILGVIFTENAGLAILQSVGIDLWGRWPLTIHSAGWGLGANLVVCVLFSAFTQDAADRERRMKYHTFLSERASLPQGKKALRPLAWAAVVGWLFFGVGPGAVIGNDIFGAPDAGLDGWWFGIPSIWAWQILFWGLGVGMMWFLAYKMEMSTVPEKEIEALVDDVAESARRF